MKSHPFVEAVATLNPVSLTGSVEEVGAGYVRANGPIASLGDICAIRNPFDQGVRHRLAEVVSVSRRGVTLVPLEGIENVRPGCKVLLKSGEQAAKVGNCFSERMVDALARPLDGKGDIKGAELRPLEGRIPMPLERIATSQRLDTGVKAIDGVVPIAKGQRIGVFAASGVGKTTLVSQLARQVDCDRVVMCLTGERGREVERMWQTVKDGQALAEATIVAATSDTSAILRTRAVSQALALAEYWRDAGDDVLLIVDSITRYAMALREIGLAAGAPPAMRGYTANVFAALPKIVERCGGLKKGGSITGIFSVLSETDDVDDPIVEAMKSYLDGHIILSRDLAESGHFPAIDTLKSVSRLAPDVMDDQEVFYARAVVANLSAYRRSRVLIESGMYKSGGDPELDRAIQLRPILRDFLVQDAMTPHPAKQTRQLLSSLLGGRTDG